MWKSKSFLDRNYSSIPPPSINDLRYEVYGEESPPVGNYPLHEGSEADPKQIFLIVFALACFLLAGSILVTYVALLMSNRSAVA
jgi:hypothetical protein